MQRSAADVVASRDRSTIRLRAFANPTITNTPTNETMAMEGPKSADTVPSSAVSANVRAPRSLLDHSLSIPTSNPMPSETPIFAATSDVGNRVTNIDMLQAKVYTLRIDTTGTIW